MTDTIVARVAALRTANAAELKQMWRDMFQQEPPPFNRRFLETRLAYRVQELAYGGLKRESIKRLEKLGEQLDGGKNEVRRRRADNRPVAGTRLIRDWQGVPHEVIVGIDHFGASAGGALLYEKFGITADAAVAKAKALLA